MGATKAQGVILQPFPYRQDCRSRYGHALLYVSDTTPDLMSTC